MVGLQKRRVADSGGRSGYDLFITADQEISYQQNFAGRKLAVMVLSTNNWDRVKAGVGHILAAIAKLAPGGYADVHVPE